MIIFNIDEKEMVCFIAECLTGVNIHGYINHPNPKKRKPIVSKIGKEVAQKEAIAIVAGLQAYEIPQQALRARVGEQIGEY